MGNLVIVAIPEEMDRVWKVSSEKVPHLTLLFLGDEANADTQQIVEFVEHAVTLSEHGQFYLDVDRRDTLGPDEADVLLFSKRSWNLKWITQFRGQLLKNNAIRTAYDSTQQYDEWVPHLTLGYPETPAKPIPDDGFAHPIYSVCFDRIAVWDTDYAGPEFRLEWPDRELTGDLAVAYSDTQKVALTHYVENGMATREEILEHHGVKGMRWGQRSTQDHSNARGETIKGAALGVGAMLSPSFRRNVPGPTKVKVSVFGAYALLSGKVRKDLREASKKSAIQKADNQWEKGLRDGSAFIAVHNAAADHFNAKIASVNSKHPADFTKDTKNFDDPSTYGPKYKAYMKDVDKLTQDSIKHAGNELELKNPSGTRQVEISQGPSGMPGDYHLSVKNVKHAATDNQTLAIQVKFTLDGNGRVTGFTFPDEEDNSVAQSAIERGREFVEHRSVLDNPSVAEQIKAKVQSILDDVKGDNKDANLFGDPLIQAKIRSVLQDFYQDPNVDNAVVYDALGEVFLQHWGVKGMRWGFRRSGTTPSPVSSQSTHTLLRGKAKVQTQGGEHHPAHEDAVKVAEARQKLKKSGVEALSNKDLQDVATRLNLENQVAVLSSSRGKKFVTQQLHEEGKNIARRGIREGLKRGAKRVGKGAATAAVVAA